MEWLDKLRQVKEQLDGIADAGADYMRRFAAAMRQAADGIEGAADSIDPTPNEIGTRANETKVEEFLSECERDRATLRPGPDGTEATALAGPGTDAKALPPILLDIIIAALRAWLSRRNNGAA